MEEYESKVNLLSRNKKTAVVINDRESSSCVGWSGDTQVMLCPVILVRCHGPGIGYPCHFFNKITDGRHIAPHLDLDLISVLFTVEL